jgi:hypothetical protein
MQGQSDPANNRPHNHTTTTHNPGSTTQTRQRPKPMVGCAVCSTVGLGDR